MGYLLKILRTLMGLSIWFSFCWSSPSPLNRNDKDSGSSMIDPKIYGTEPYQLQIHEPTPSSVVSHGSNNNYYPRGSSRYPATSTDQSQQHHAQRYNTRHKYSNSNNQQRNPDRPRIQEHDYDPFYFTTARNEPIGVTRNRRNSKFREFFTIDDDPLSNHLLDEDVHFFRRSQKPLLMSNKFRGHPDERESSIESVHYYNDDHRRLPLYEDPTPYFPSSRSSFPHRRQDHFDLSSPSSLHMASYDRRGSRYPPFSNHLDFYDNPRRHHGYIPKIHVPERYAREPVEGWSVQVGTQLKVHDDGRERNPARFYVRDEKPGNIRRYPHNYGDYSRE